MAKPLHTIADLGAPFWRIVAAGVVKRIKQLTAGGQGVSGRFHAYSDDYREAKAGGEFKRQSSTSSRPNLMLTGDMMRDLKVIKVDKNGAQVGWSAFGDRMRYNADKGRAISTEDQALHSGIERWIFKEIDKKVESNIKAARVTKRVPVRVI